MAILKDLIVNGSSRFLNAAYYNKIKANSLAAEDGYFNRLVAVSGKISDLDVEDLTAQNATVIGLLDVKGELHTNSWTNSNIATIDGSFYITPTVSCASGTFAYNGTKITVTAASGHSFAVNDLYTYTASGTATTYSNWPQYSKVLLTGEVQLSGSNEWLPLGTIRGQIASSSTSSIEINSLSDSKGQTPIATLDELGSTSISNATFRNIKVSLYQRASNSTSFYPIGIYMTALGQNGKTFLDIYGGGDKVASVTNTIGGTSYNSGALAPPVLRIGNLAGLPNVGDVTPNGWGIYTTNGFFSGTIAAKQGKIGGYSIGTSNLTKGTTQNASGSFWLTPEGQAATMSALINSSQTWAQTIGQNFGVTTAGILYATGATITGNIKAKSFSALDSNSKERATVNTNGFIVKDASGNTVASLSNDLTLGQVVANRYNVFIDADVGIQNRKNTSVLSQFDSTSIKFYDGSGTAAANITAQFSSGGATIGKTTGTNGNVIIDSSGMKARQGTTELASFTGDGATIGANSSGTTRTVITSSGVDFIRKDGSTDYILAHIGYGNGITETSEYGIAPYYTFGVRKPNSEVGNYSLVEGHWNTASKYGSHAEGSGTIASGSYSHAEGWETTASGSVSHAEGSNTVASGNFSHAEGFGTKATQQFQHVCGEYNATEGYYAFIIGNGSSDTARSNALTVDWHGNVDPAMGYGFIYFDDKAVTSKSNIIITGPTKCSCIGSLFTTVTNGIRVLKTGDYLIETSWTGVSSLSNSTNVKAFGAGVNGSTSTQYACAMGRGNSWNTYSNFDVVYLTANQYVEILGRNEAGAGAFNISLVIRPLWLW